MQRTWLGLATAGVLLVLFCAIFHERRSRVPSDFQFQSHFSKTEALIYAAARHDLVEGYWNSIGRNLRNMRFQYAWDKWRNGAGHVDGVLTNSNADVMVFVRFKNGDNFWMTLRPGNGRGSGYARSHP
jgi:hypothetical protein